MSVLYYKRDDGTLVTVGSGAEPVGRRNLFINGDCRVSQRAYVGTTPGSAVNTYGWSDRWYALAFGTATLSIDAVAGGQGPGQANLRVYTAVANAALGTSDYGCFGQSIEPDTLHHLRWGTPYAKPVTISFWINTPQTGVHSISVRNATASRILVTTFTVNAANTWEYKTVRIPGCTDGTWSASSSINVRFGLWGGSTRVTSTLDAWQATSSLFIVANTQTTTYHTTTGIANGVLITNLQMEVGDVATPFELRHYSDELALCQHFFWRMGAHALNWEIMALGMVTAAQGGAVYVTFPVQMRTTPTVTINNIGGFAIWTGPNSNVLTNLALGPDGTSPSMARLDWAHGGTASVVGGAAVLRRNATTSASVDFAAEQG